MATFKEVKRGIEAQVCVNRVRRSKTLPTLAQAKRWAKDMERTLRAETAGGFVSAGSTPILSLLLDYERETQDQWSRSKSLSVRRLKSDMTLRVDQLTPKAVRDWAVNRKYALGVTRVDLKTLSGAIKYANTAWFTQIDTAGIIAAMASLQASGRMPPVNKRDRRVTDEELHLIRENWRSNKIPFDIVEFLVECPLRSIEACNLEWSDVSGRIISVRNRKDPTNNHRVDRVPLLGKSYDILMAQSGSRPFPYLQGTVSHVFREAARRAGIENIKLHDLRHEGISRMAEAGYTVPQICVVSGHQSWETVRRYTHVTAESLLQPT